MERLLQGSVKLESRSTPIFMRYDKKGSWAIAKDEFRAIADKVSVRTRADRTVVILVILYMYIYLLDIWNTSRQCLMYIALK